MRISSPCERGVRVLITPFRPTSIHYTVVLSIPWWKLFVVIASLFSSAFGIDCVRCVRISFPRNSLVSVYIRLCIPGTSINASVRVQPCQTTTGGRFSKNCTQVDHPFFPLLVCTRGDVLMEKMWPHFTHDACKIMPRPKCMLSSPMIHFHHIFAVCSQCIDGITKLVNVHNSAATE